MAMNLSGQSYVDIIEMPVKKLEEYIEWKTKFDSDIAKMKEEYLKNIKSNSRSR